MTLEDVLHELLQRLGNEGDCIISWEQMQEWPEAGFDVFLKAGWIKPASPATTVECPGCEENCLMPAHIFPAIGEQAARAYVACDRRDDVGRVKVSMDRLQQWQLSQSQVAQWLAHALDLKGKPEQDKTTGIFKLGAVQGKKRINLVELDMANPVCLKSSGHSLPLAKLVQFENGQLGIIRKTLLGFVDLPPALEKAQHYQSSTIRREARKLETKALHDSWKKEYRKLKKNKPAKSDVWYSQTIARMKIAEGRDSETIRKSMKR